VKYVEIIREALLYIFPHYANLLKGEKIMAADPNTTSDTNTYEDDTHRYTKVDGKYIRKMVNDWIDDNPGKTIGFIFLAGTVLTCKVFQNICTRAVYKGNLRTIKYLMKYSK